MIKKVGLILFFAAACMLHAQILTEDYGFENQPAGELTDQAGWVPFRSLPSFTHIIEEAGVAYEGTKNAFLSLPAGATGFQRVTLYQSEVLEPGVEYHASVMVQWANYTPGKNVIVSFWAWHQQTDCYAGKDVWITTTGWQEISFDFYNTGSAGDLWKLSVTLLPNQSPTQMDLRVDNVILTRAGNMMDDFGFEGQNPGEIVEGSGWSPTKGSPAFTCVAETGAANSGYRSARLGITSDASIGQWVDLAQWKKLEPGAEYEVYCYVNWTDYTQGDSAKVEFYTWNQNLNTWYGNSFSIVTPGWQKVTYTFTASGNADDWNKIYIALNPQGRNVSLAVDDFTVCRILYPSTDGVGNNLMNDPGFEAQPLGAITSNHGWDFWTNAVSFTSVIEESNPHSGSRHARIAIPANTSNYESMLLGQWKHLEPGALYRASCWINWTDYVPGRQVIVIFWAWHQQSGIWYGADDVQVTRSGWHEISFNHIPVGKSQDWWRIYVSLNGWGNFGNPVEILLDDFTMVKMGNQTPVEEKAIPAPLAFGLGQNFPNPFNPETTLRFSLRQEGHAVLKVYDITGREVATLADAWMGSGSHAVTWYGRDESGNTLPSGIYLYRLQAGKESVTRKMTLIR